MVIDQFAQREQHLVERIRRVRIVNYNQWPAAATDLLQAARNRIEPRHRRDRILKFDIAGEQHREYAQYIRRVVAPDHRALDGRRTKRKTKVKEHERRDGNK